MRILCLVDGSFDENRVGAELQLLCIGYRHVTPRALHLQIVDTLIAYQRHRSWVELCGHA